MSKEAMKLALGKIKSARDCHPNAVNTLLFEAEEILEEALAKPDFWEGYVPEPVKPAQCKYPKCSYPCTDLPDCRDAEQPAQQALDKKAENARELGLDYEPAQEPVAWVCYGSNNKLDIDFFDDEIADLAVGTKLYTHAQRTWVGLDDKDYRELHLQMGPTYFYQDYGRAIEAKLKEKNT